MSDSDNKWFVSDEKYGPYRLKKYNYSVFDDSHSVLPTFDSDELDEYAAEITKDTVYKILQKKGFNHQIAKEDLRVVVDLDYGGCGVNTSSIEVYLNWDSLKGDDDDFTLCHKVWTIVAEELNNVEEMSEDDIWFKIYEDAMEYSYYVEDMTEEDFRKLYRQSKILYVQSDFNFKFEKDCNYKQCVEGYIKMGCDPSSIKVVDFVEGRKVNEVHDA